MDSGVMPSWFYIYEIPVTSVVSYSSIVLASCNLLSSYKKDEDVEVQEEEPIVKDEDVEVQQEEKPTEEDEVKFIKIEESEEEDAICLLQKAGASFDKSLTPILWSHGMADRTVLFEAGQAGPPFLVQAGMSCEFKELWEVVQFLVDGSFLIHQLLDVFHQKQKRHLFTRLMVWLTVLYYLRRGKLDLLFWSKLVLSCEFKAYPNVGHSITTEELLHLQSWIKALV
ncbi:uncharacterized protein LOC121989705 [Zingiber officinale]|uniref:uncharacterized protein LOC121989705 n=1 Tax=Zingiber officinale TaxID=94328 RepID=UPI001C4AE09A|nr:uncharacterized protein LOC121989705 [Zingiber officinale]